MHINKRIRLLLVNKSWIWICVDMVKDKVPTSASFALKQHLLTGCQVSWVSSHL